MHVLEPVFEDVEVAPGNRTTYSSFIELGGDRVLHGFTNFVKWTASEEDVEKLAADSEEADRIRAGKALIPQISGRISADRGRSWGDRFTLYPSLVRGSDAVSFLRIPSGRILMIIGMVGYRYWIDNRPFCCFSDDEGKTWSDPTYIGFLKPVWHNILHDSLIQLQSGRLILPVSWTVDYEKTQTENFKSAALISDNGGMSWRRGKGYTNCRESTAGVPEPRIVELRDGRLLMFMRTHDTGRMARAFSDDEGETWSEAELFLENAQAPCTLKRVPGRDEIILVWSHEPGKNLNQREVLNIAASRDEGESWDREWYLEEYHSGRRYGYATVIFLGEETWVSYYYSDQEKDRGKILKLKIFATSQLLTLTDRSSLPGSNA